MSEGETIHVRVLFFAMARELAGVHETELDLTEPATAADAEEALKARFDWLGARLASYRLAVDEEFAAPETSLRDGSVVAIIPPVSGG